MILKSRPNVKMPDFAKAEGEGTKNVLQQMMRVLYDSFKNIYDDLVNVGTGRDSALPTASVDFLGKIYLKTNTGAEDTLHICIFEDVTQTYLWKEIALT